MTGPSARAGRAGKRRAGAAAALLVAALVVVLAALFLWLNVCCGSGR